MSSKIKILVYLISLLLSIVIIRYSFEEQDLSNLALGKHTSTYFAKNKNNNIIHVSNIDSLAKSKMIEIWMSNVEKDISLVLGNSQTNYINQMKISEYNYIEILDEKIEFCFLNTKVYRL